MYIHDIIYDAYSLLPVELTCCCSTCSAAGRTLSSSWSLAVVAAERGVTLSGTSKKSYSNKQWAIAKRE